MESLPLTEQEWEKVKRGLEVLKLREEGHRCAMAAHGVGSDLSPGEVAQVLVKVINRLALHVGEGEEVVTEDRMALVEKRVTILEDGVLAGIEEKVKRGTREEAWGEVVEEVEGMGLPSGMIVVFEEEEEARKKFPGKRVLAVRIDALKPPGELVRGCVPLRVVIAERVGRSGPWAWMRLDEPEVERLGNFLEEMGVWTRWRFAVMGVKVKEGSDG